MASVIDPIEIARTNPGVEPKKIEQAAAFRSVLEKAGIAIRPKYDIAPALGDVPHRPAPKAPHIVRLTR